MTYRRAVRSFGMTHRRPVRKVSWSTAMIRMNWAFALVPAACMFTAAGSRQGTKPRAAAPATVQELLTRLERAAAGLQDYTVTGVTETGGKRSEERRVGKE